jgi:hypothetical protein
MHIKTPDTYSCSTQRISCTTVLPLIITTDLQQSKQEPCTAVANIPEQYMHVLMNIIYKMAVYVSEEVSFLSLEHNNPGTLHISFH